MIDPLIVLEGEAEVMRDWLAGGNFYEVLVDGWDLLDVIEERWEVDNEGRQRLGKVRLTIELVDD